MPKFWHFFVKDIAHSAQHTTAYDACVVTVSTTKLKKLVYSHVLHIGLEHVGSLHVISYVL